ncbi:hypothetical protein B0T26DRAFT_671044 [Lasiosphaeria miniovina]|uniref:Uncharacterized protein n=1 Tax=Lasiosphaeria miniovina TaxID=1954250 RepID=A0AA40BIG1_9PEZI|nr:uncharacterized protein B0T26DRAFT_671044 [Lasiosphaeria miniovina]KAK0734807.1 hypothetical protein B0T26DRAFT_671044 [Lasiosphaeria miniovina]
MAKLSIAALVATVYIPSVRSSLGSMFAHDFHTRRTRRLVSTITPEALCNGPCGHKANGLGGVKARLRGVLKGNVIPPYSLGNPPPSTNGGVAGTDLEKKTLAAPQQQQVIELSNEYGMKPFDARVRDSKTASRSLVPYRPQCRSHQHPRGTNGKLVSDIELLGLDPPGVVFTCSVEDLAGLGEDLNKDRARSSSLLAIYPLTTPRRGEN